MIHRRPLIILHHILLSIVQCLSIIPSKHNNSGIIRAFDTNMRAPSSGHGLDLDPFITTVVILFPACLVLLPIPTSEYIDHPVLACNTMHSSWEDHIWAFFPYLCIKVIFFHTF